MAFSFNPTSEDRTELIITMIRQGIGDTEEGVQKRPGDQPNFSDDEILLFYTAEGHHIKRAVCAGVEALASEWSSLQGYERIGDIETGTQRATTYSMIAKNMRKEVGFGSPANAETIGTGNAAFNTRFN